MTVEEHKKALRHLVKVDPILAAVIKKVKLEHREPYPNHFEYLVGSIISQQLSTKAADTIERRFKELFGKRGFPKPEVVIRMPDTKLRSAGLSNAKVAFIKDLSRHIAEKKIRIKKLPQLSAEEIMLELIAVKGIGKWTVEMFLIGGLGHPDVFSYGDLGLRNAMQRLYGLRKTPTEKRAAQISNNWKPYRSVASRLLWKSLDMK